MSVLALCTIAVCDENPSVLKKRIIPIRTRINFPKTHERIIVPLDPIKVDEVNVKPVREPSRETNFRRKPKIVEEVAKVTTVKPRQSKRNPKNYDDGKGNSQNSYNYVIRSGDPKPSKDNQPIQPLNINTQVFKKSPPQSTVSTKPPTGKYQSRIRTKNPEEIHEMKNMVEDSRKKLKVENLPENPIEIPATSWFDNTGKYSYGILHEGNFMEPAVYKPEHDENAKHVEPIGPPKIFKSSFRDPSARVEHIAQGKNLGNFLYKSEVHYPSYHQHLYPPVVTYGNPVYEAKPATKELPTPTTVLHKSPPQPRLPKEEVKPEKPQSARKPQKPKESEKQAPAEQNDEDYEEDDDSGDYEDPGNNDKYDGDAPGNDDEGGDDEEESDDRDGNESDDDDEESEDDSDSDDAPKYRYAYDGDARDNSGSEESDEFDRSWSKYGYGPRKSNTRSDEESESDESSESQETQIAPQRIKFYHEKKEQITTPMLRPTTKAPVQLKKLARSMSGALNNSKPKSVKSQEEKSQPADDLKYFQ